MFFVPALFGMNPEKLKIDQTQLQRHVLKIFDSGVLEPFSCNCSPLSPFKLDHVVISTSHNFKSGHAEKPLIHSKSTFTFKQTLTSI